MLATFLRGATSAATSPIQYVGGYIAAYSGTTSNINVTLTSLTGGLASAPSTGDLVIVYFGTGSGANRDLVIGSSFIEISELYANDTEDTNLVVARKFMGVTPDTSFTITGGTLDTADAGVVAVQVWRGVSTITPLDVTPTTATGIDSVLCDPPAITPITSGAIIVVGGAGAHTAGGQDFSSTGLKSFITDGQNDTNDVTVGLGYKIWTSGTFDPAPFTFSAADNTAYSWAAVTLALRPA